MYSTSSTIEMQLTINGNNHMINIYIITINEIQLIIGSTLILAADWSISLMY